MLMQMLRVQLCLLTLATTALASPSYDGSLILTKDGRVKSYMIPPYQSNHASFLELLPDGGMLMAWFSGTKEGANDCSIVSAAMRTGEYNWSEATLRSRRSGFSNQNPVFFRDPASSRLFLFHSQQPAYKGEANATVWFVESMDGAGGDWTSPALVFDKPGSFIRNRMLLSTAGSWLFPMYFAGTSQFSAIQVSKNHSPTSWNEQDMEGSDWLVQPSVVRLPSSLLNTFSDTRRDVESSSETFLRSFFRDRKKRNIWVADSTNEGKSWTVPTKTVLPNNNAAIQATFLTSGKVAIVYNPTNSARNILSVSLSEDGGKTWSVTRDLEHHSDEAHELSYPTLVQDETTGDIHISYTYLRETIKYVCVTEEWIEGKSNPRLCASSSHAKPEDVRDGDASAGSDGVEVEGANEIDGSRICAFCHSVMDAIGDVAFAELGDVDMLLDKVCDYAEVSTESCGDLKGWIWENEKAVKDICEYAFCNPQ